MCAGRPPFPYLRWCGPRFPRERAATEGRPNSFQAALREYAIKFRPIPPRSPQLNGKVERSQQTDWVEFYATADLADPDLPLCLEEWQFFYN